MKKIKPIILCLLFLSCFWGCIGEDEVTKGIFLLIKDRDRPSDVFIRERGKPSYELLTNPSKGRRIVSVFFGDDKNGVLLKELYNINDHYSYTLFLTRDGGKTWEETNTFEGSFYKMQFVDYQIGYLRVGDVLRKTLDGGRS